MNWHDEGVIIPTARDLSYMRNVAANNFTKARKRATDDGRRWFRFGGRWYCSACVRFATKRAAIRHGVGCENRDGERVEL